MRLLILYIFCCFPGMIFAQLNLESRGSIPEELYISTVDKFNKKRQESLDSSFNEPRAIRLSQLGFYANSLFLIDAIKNNANISINDAYTKLLNDIADHLLKDDPELRSRIHLYAYRSPYVNAFSTDQGDLFFTTGLLAHCRTEGELAFVVAHEIIHTRKQHNMTGFNEKIRIYRGEGEYKDMDVDKSLERIHSFSRNLEREADTTALEYFFKSVYNTSAVTSALEMLKTAHLSYGEVPFNWSLVSGSTYTMPAEYLPDSLPKTQVDTSDDPRSTHPNLHERIAYCKQIIQKRPGSGEKSYHFLSKSEFELLRLSARQALLEYWYNEHHYAKAIYTAALLHAENPDPRYVQFMRQCINAEIQVRNAGYVTDERKNRDYTGELYKPWYFLYELKKYETAGVNFIMTWERYVLNPESGLEDEVVRSLKGFLFNIKNDWKKLAADDFDTSKVGMKKYDALLPDLKRIFESELYRSHFKNPTKYLDETEAWDKKKELQINAEIGELQTQKLIVLNPYYMRYDEQIDGYVDLVNSYENELNLLQSVKLAATRNNIDISLLDVRDIGRENARAFDDISVLTNYLGRYMVYDLNSAWNVLPSNESAIRGIRERYNARYMMWIGVRSYKGTSFKSRGSLLLALLFPQYLPFGLLRSMEKDHELEMFHVLIDLEKHRIVRSDHISVEYMKDNTSNVAIYLNAFFKKL
ncbi:MAG: M48 family metalloprotease [Flavobacteriales bacterium]|nr:M48 family metalloprotease [Flavobacteriales bacterium]